MSTFSGTQHAAGASSVQDFFLDFKENIQTMAGKPIFAKGVPLSPFYSTRLAGYCVIITILIDVMRSILDYLKVDFGNGFDDIIRGLHQMAVSLTFIVLGLFLVNFKV